MHITPDSGASETMMHPGQEFVYCLEGTVQYEVGNQTYDLQAGDSLMFHATQPHRFWNRGAAIARVLLIFQATEGNYLARQRHLEV